MNHAPFALPTPVSAVIFDCDGTLSAIEGIDELAKQNNIGDLVRSMTETAMGQSGIHPKLYQERLNLVKPRKEQVTALGHQYYSHQVPDAKAVIQLLKRLNKTIYLVSAGLYPAVSIFGELLQVPRENIFAVDIQFDETGNYLSHDTASPLIDNHGKRAIITQLKLIHPRLVHVGDGLNDYAVYDMVTRFVGYGGVSFREKIASCCPYYIKGISMSALLAYVLTETEQSTLTASEQALYQKGLAAIDAITVEAD